MRVMLAEAGVRGDGSDGGDSGGDGNGGGGSGNGGGGSGNGGGGSGNDSEPHPSTQKSHVIWSP